LFIYIILIYNTSAIVTCLLKATSLDLTLMFHMLTNDIQTLLGLFCSTGAVLLQTGVNFKLQIAHIAFIYTERVFGLIVSKVLALLILTSVPANRVKSHLASSLVKPCPHCRRKVRLSQKTARQRRQSRNSATVALFCDSVERLNTAG